MGPETLAGGNGRIGGIRDIPPARRLLLLPHCLRPNRDCPGEMTRQGLICDGCTRANCKIHAILEIATRAGYPNICVAPGGRLAVRRVAEVRPAAIIAVACDKELADGVAAVNALEWQGTVPPIVQVPLLRDGCVDTDVDLAHVTRVLAS